MGTQVIATAPKYYQMILCLDPVLYARSIRKMTIPVMTCTTAREINQYPEILEVTDYLLPSPTSRHDAAIRHLVCGDELGVNTKGDEKGNEEPKNKEPVG